MLTFRTFCEAIPLPPPRITQQDIGAADMSTRVAYGKSAEAGILSSLRSVGWDIVPVGSDRGDMLDKIDAYVRVNGASVPLQIKYRDRGDDILLEVIKGWTPASFGAGVPLVMNGRDMVGKAVLYACLNKAGTVVRVRLASEAKDAAASMVKKLKDNFRKTDGAMQSVQTPRGEARITRDPATGVNKVMAFIHPEALTKKIPAALTVGGVMDIPVRGGSLYAA